MAFTLRIDHDFDKLQRRLKQIHRKEIPFATSVALNRTAQKVKQAEIAEMKRVFDRPTRWPLQGLHVVDASKENLEASVHFKDFAGKGVPAGRYLHAQVYGGPRRQKSSEKQLQAAGTMGNAGYWVPGPGAPLDAHGNVPGSVINRILSQVKARQDPSQNETARSRKRNKRAPRYFAIGPGQRLTAGIWERQGKQIKLVLIFVPRAPQYDKRFDFYGVANRTMKKVFPKEFSRAFKSAIKTAR